MIRIAEEIEDRFRVEPGTPADLAGRDPAWAGPESIAKARRKRFAKVVLKSGRQALAETQEMLYAADTWSVLVVLQAMDAAGKDSTIKYVFSGVNPQGCQVVSFKAPSAQELDHDFLWRCVRVLPERGRIGIFNRSYYEEVLVVRVRPELLERQRLPRGVAGSELWRQRYESINHFEQHLVRNGTQVVKFFLHLSPEEQRERFLKRLRRPDKHWKFNPADLTERGRWDHYMAAYEEALTATSTEWAPWYVVPADRKWVTRALVSEILCRRIRELGVGFPQVSEGERVELAAAEERLTAEVAAESESESESGERGGE